MTPNIQEVVKHLVNDSLAESLCKVCLLPLDELSESIFTKVCKENTEYCIADVLENVCRIQISDNDKSFVCSECFARASQAYKFYLLTKRSDEIVEFYLQELRTHIEDLELDSNIVADSLCITLPDFIPETKEFDFNYEGILANDILSLTDFKPKETKHEYSDSDDDEIVVVMDRGKPSYYKINADGELQMISDCNTKILRNVFKNGRDGKRRRRRDPMKYRQCSQCPVKYRFLSKLKEHMQIEHKIDLHICKICKATFEDYEEFQQHVRSHLENMTQENCAKKVKKLLNTDGMIQEDSVNEEEEDTISSEKAHICEHCGVLLDNEEKLLEHYEKKHLKKYTCYYCGKMYKGELSFEIHIKKHESHSKNNKGKKQLVEKKKARNSMCNICGRSFVDDRSLMWHTRLHTNERPYKCETCGRGFISLNRRNQHAVCAHSAPARRCPLCPALFHLTSMVNTHIKKVHLKSHKRKNRSSKYNDVHWKTEPVQLQELSVSIQNELLELQTQKANQKVEWKSKPRVEVKIEQNENGVYQFWPAA